MKNLKIEGTLNTPEIIFDVDNKVFALNGSSLPEYGGEFYDNVESNLLDFFDEIKDGLTVIYNIEYMNTTSNKRIFHMFKTCIAKVKNVQFIWRYDVEDDDMKEQGEFFEHGLKTSFKYESYQ